MRKLITLLLFLLPFIIEAQSDSIRSEDVRFQINKIEELRKQANYQEALVLCDSMLVILGQDSVRFDTLIAEVYIYQGLAYYYLQRFEDSKKVLLRSVRVLEGAYGEYNKKIVKPLTTIGIAFIDQGDNQAGLAYLNKALTIMDSIAKEDDPYWPVLYTNFGVYYSSIYDLDNAILFYSKALAVDEQLSKDSIGLLIGYFNLGAMYSIQSDSKKSLSYYNKSLSIFQEIVEIDSFYWSMIQCNTGDSYFNMGMKDTAFQFYNQSLQPLLNKQGYNAFKSRIYRALGKYHKDQSEFELSLGLFYKSLAFARAKGSKSTEIIFDCYKYLAETYGELGQTNHGLSLIDTAFATINFDERNPTPWNALIPKSTILDGVRAKTSILLSSYERNRNEADLHQAYLSNTLGLNIIDSIKQDLKEKSSQQFVIDRVFSVYENAMKIQYNLLNLNGDQNHINEAFQIAEKCKSNVLLDAVLKSKALTFANLPQEVLDEETMLKSEITNTERHLHTLSTDKTSQNGAKFNNLKHQLFDLKIAMQELLTELETNYPKYYDLKYKSTPTEISTVQKELLNDSSSLLEYFVGEETIYALVINDQQSGFIKLGATEVIEPLVKDFCKMVSKFNAISMDMDRHCINFTELSFNLYQKLFQPVERLLNEHTIIIPDGFLTYLSFDALIETIPKNTWDIRNYDFLVKHYTLSYNYSADLMLEMKSSNDNEPAAKNKLLAIAPSFETAYTGTHLRSGDLAPLQYNVKEVETLLALCDGKALVNKHANKNRFLKEAADYTAIHFATHGKANDESGAYSYLAFSQNAEATGDENILFTLDIYNLVLRANLVVLSACETGIGEWERGEGMISLARAFAYAGANHIITTLWKVSDNKAAGIMKYYYENLQDGIGKSTALRQAKLSYLAENNKEAAHPFYWASFISIGDDELLILDSPKKAWISSNTIFLVVLICLILFFVIKYSNKRNKIKSIPVTNV